MDLGLLARLDRLGVPRGAEAPLVAGHNLRGERGVRPRRGFESFGTAIAPLETSTAGSACSGRCPRSRKTPGSLRWPQYTRCAGLRRPGRSSSGRPGRIRYQYRCRARRRSSTRGRLRGRCAARRCQDPRAASRRASWRVAAPWSAAGRRRLLRRHGPSWSSTRRREKSAWRQLPAWRVLTSPTMCPSSSSVRAPVEVTSRSYPARRQRSP